MSEVSKDVQHPQLSDGVSVSPEISKPCLRPRCLPVSLPGREPFRGIRGTSQCSLSDKSNHGNEHEIDFVQAIPNIQEIYSSRSQWRVMSWRRDCNLVLSSSIYELSWLSALDNGYNIIEDSRRAVSMLIIHWRKNSKGDKLLEKFSLYRFYHNGKPEHHRYFPCVLVRGSSYH